MGENPYHRQLYGEKLEMLLKVVLKYCLFDTLKIISPHEKLAIAFYQQCLEISGKSVHTFSSYYIF